MNWILKHRRARLYIVVCTVFLLAPGLAQASAGDDLLNSFKRFVNFAFLFSGGGIVLAWLRVAWTYFFSDFPEETMKRVKQACMGSVICGMAFSFAELFLSLATKKTL